MTKIRFAIHGFLKNALLGFLVTFIFFISLEIMVRAYYCINTRNSYYLYYGNRDMQSFLKPFVAKIIKNTQINKNGISILVFGGSTTNWNVIPQEDNYPEILEEIIKKEKPGLKINVMNYGRGGMESLGELQVMKEVLNATSIMPKAVFVYSGLNDAINTRLLEKRVSKGKIGYYVKTEYIKLDFFTKLNGVLEKASLLYMVLKEKIAKEVFKDINYFDKKIVSTGRKEYKEKSYEKDRFSRLRIRSFGNNIEQMIRLCRYNGVKIYFGTTPLSDEYKKTYPEYSQLLAEMYKELFRICDKNKASIIDISSIVDKLPKSTSAKIFFSDDIHMTREGNVLIAKIIYDAIKNDIDR